MKLHTKKEKIEVEAIDENAILELSNSWSEYNENLIKTNFQDNYQ